jgi:hypothetical protein
LPLALLLKGNQHMAKVNGIASSWIDALLEIMTVVKEGRLKNYKMAILSHLYLAQFTSPD